MCTIYPNREPLEGECDGINHHDDRLTYEPLVDLVWKYLAAVEIEEGQALALRDLRVYVCETFFRPGIPGCCGYDRKQNHSTIGVGEDGYFHRKGCPNGPHTKGCGCAKCSPELT